MTTTAQQSGCPQGLPTLPPGLAERYVYDVPAAVRAKICARCDRFGGPNVPYDTEAVAFTHVPKV